MKHALHPEADAEFLEAVRHYAAIRPELGERFYDEIAELLQGICAHPNRYRLYDPPVRRVLGRVFGMASSARPSIWVTSFQGIAPYV